MGHTCSYPCGGARHDAILNRGIATADAATQVEATDWAEPRRSTRLPEATRATIVKGGVVVRSSAVKGIVSELVIALVEQARTDAEIDAVAVLAHQILRSNGISTAAAPTIAAPGTSGASSWRQFAASTTTDSTSAMRPLTISSRTS